MQMQLFDVVCVLASVCVCVCLFSEIDFCGFGALLLSAAKRKDDLPRSCSHESIKVQSTRVVNFGRFYSTQGQLVGCVCQTS